VHRVHASYETDQLLVQLRGSGSDEQAVRARLREVGYEPKE
jgi:hypothetical protein